MDMRGVKPKDIQEYLGFGCVQSVYRWLDGVSMPTVDNLYAISKKVLVGDVTMSIDSILIKMAQLNRRKTVLDVMRKYQEYDKNCRWQ